MTKRDTKRHGPKPRHGETMVPVSIRMRQSEIDEIDKAAAGRAKKMKIAWSRTDEIRERLQDTFASRDPIEAQARGLANLIGLIIEELQERSGEPLDTSAFNQVALHHAIATIIPKEGHQPVKVPARLAADAAALQRAGMTDPYADYFGMSVATQVFNLVNRAGSPDNLLGHLSGDRAMLVRSIYRDLNLRKLIGHWWAEETWQKPKAEGEAQ
jgi:hypothetical protein